MQRNAVLRLGEHHSVAFAAHAERFAFDRHPAHDQFLSPALRLHPVMHTLVLYPARGSQRVLTPLVLNVDQRPLPAAEREMLDAGEEEEIIVFIHLRSLRSASREAPPARYHNRLHFQVHPLRHGL